MNLVSVNNSSSPSLVLMGIEGLRAVIEYAGMHLTHWGDLPRGDGQSVVLFPGLAADKHSVMPLKTFFEGLGYTVHDWGRGFNVGPEGEPGPWLDQLASEVQSITHHECGKTSLIGWSLGGIYAREVAKRIPARVRQVITLGTPFAGDVDQTNVAWAYRLLNGRHPPLDEAFSAQLKIAPPMPTTSIYSRSDGIVAWQACLQEGDAPHTENIEVDGSHCGLGWNSAVLKIMAERLSQQEGRWQRHAQ
jgi:pimeloyl-ACP methyl ester carboxylesterase